MPLLLISTAIAASANNIAVLIIFRFLAGLGGSGALAVGAGTIADLWHARTQGRGALFFVMAPFLGPALGPLTGAYIISEYHNDWRYSLWVVLIIASPISLMALFMSETSHSRILHLRTTRYGIKPPYAKGDTAILLRKLRTAFIRPLHMMFVEPLVAYISIYTGFAFAMMFSFFGSYSYVFTSVYHFNQEEVGLTYIGILIGFFFAVASFGLFDSTKKHTPAPTVNQRPNSVSTPHS
jgi:MFS family permease